MSPAYIFTKQGVSIMSLKSKDTKEVTFDDLLEGMEYEYQEDREYTTISGKPQKDISSYSTFKSYDLDVGEDPVGYPEVTIFTNDDKKYDSLRLRLIIEEDEEVLDCYANIPKRDKLGFISNIRKGFDFYRTAFDFIYSVLKYRDERNVVDENGEEKNFFKKVNIETFAKYVDQFERVGVKITEGNPDSTYDSWEIYKME
jgi:hypothetical protein